MQKDLPEAIVQLQYLMTAADTETGQAVKDNTAIFEQLFRENFERLHRYAYTMVKNESVAEEIVQQVFCRLWEIKDSVRLGEHATAYLYKATYTTALNVMKHDKVRRGYRTHVLVQQSDALNVTDPAEVKELETRIVAAMNELPSQCRAVFQMSRYEGLKHKEIAAQLGISVKTVENHVCKALEVLRKKLADYLPLICLLLINN